MEEVKHCNITEQLITPEEVHISKLPLIVRLYLLNPQLDQTGSYHCTEDSATQYLKCSAQTGEGVCEVFQFATHLALLQSMKTKSSKCILI